eukprot:jgi/Mesvir1/7966/Mv11876-RA.2
MPAEAPLIPAEALKMSAEALVTPAEALVLLAEALAMPAEALVMDPYRTTPCAAMCLAGHHNLMSIAVRAILICLGLSLSIWGYYSYGNRYVMVVLNVFIVVTILICLGFIRVMGAVVAFYLTMPLTPPHSTPFHPIPPAPDGVALRVTSPESSKPSPGAAPAGTPASKPGNAPGGARHVIRARLALDAMGNFSPIVRQMRWGTKPEGVCCVVGTCARGFREDANRTGDIIYSNVDVTCAPNGSELQYFWEAFPSGSGPTDRTTYLFAYLDAHPSRPSLEQLLDDYWRMLPAYQGVSIEELEVLRVLFGFFPSYKASPLPAGFDRILQIGDASGIQSPLSFGGFGSLTRHLARILAAVSDALEGDLLSRDHLGAINAYQPNLSSTWLYQRSMSVPPGDAVSTAAASLGQGAFASGEPIGGGGRDGRQQGLDNTGHYKSSAEGSGDQIGSQLMGGEARGQGDGAMVPASSSSSSSSSRGGGKGGFRGSFINDVLNNNFGVMKRLGDPVMMPFLQDVVEFKGLGLLMINVAISNPLILPALLGTLGIGPVIEWFGHFSSMGMYSVLHNTLGPAISSWAEKLSPEDRYYWRRRVEAWKFGSGSDYKL